MNFRPVAITTMIWSGVALALVCVWSMYTQPDFLVKLADQLWSCF